MIIILGSVVVSEKHFAEALSLSLEHVHRSRLEPGCTEHGVSIDAENPNRLLFIEKWESMQSLNAHFAVPAARKFGKALSAIASAPPSLTVYEAAEMTRVAKTAAPT